jgi:hypothetical protein
LPQVRPAYRSPTYTEHARYGSFGHTLLEPSDKLFLSGDCQVSDCAVLPKGLPMLDRSLGRIEGSNFLSVLQHVAVKDDAERYG